MKYHIAYLLFLLAVGTVIAQPYQSMFGDTSTEWIMSAVYPVSPTGYGDGNTLRFYAEKDTLVNGKTYKKIATAAGPEQYDNFLLREDLDSGIVWYRQMLTAPAKHTNCLLNDLVFMDYNLKPGDTLWIRPDFNGPVHVVDSVYLKQGKKHIRFNVEILPGEHLEMIEGIGFNTGFKTLAACVFKDVLTDTYLLCAKKDKVLTFQNYFYNGDCHPFPPVSVPAAPGKNPINLYPNPAKDKLTIHLGSNATEELRYAIINTLGHSVRRGNIDAGIREAQIDITDLPSGFYALSFENGLVQHFIKQ